MNITESFSPMGGVMWEGDLGGGDAGYSVAKSFIEKHVHAGWMLSILDVITGSTIEIDCRDLVEMPRVVSYVYNIERAAPMTFIGENPMTESYVVGMTCTRGRLNIPGIYTVENGKLVDLERN